MLREVRVVILVGVLGLGESFIGGGGGRGYNNPGGQQQQQQGPGQGHQGFGGQGRGQQMRGMPQRLPPGYANIQGEIMDMSNKVIQRVSAQGTNYYRYDDQSGGPVFKRKEMDSQRRFVLFPDQNFPQGDGHYIVLRRLRGINVPGRVAQPLYEAFHLSLTDSFHGFVNELKVDQYKSPSNFGGQSYGGGRSKRRTISLMSPYDLSTINSSSVPVEQTIKEEGDNIES